MGGIVDRNNFHSPANSTTSADKIETSISKPIHPIDTPIATKSREILMDHTYNSNDHNLEITSAKELDINELSDEEIQKLLDETDDQLVANSAELVAENKEINNIDIIINTEKNDITSVGLNPEKDIQKPQYAKAREDVSVKENEIKAEGVAIDPKDIAKNLENLHCLRDDGTRVPAKYLISLGEDGLRELSKLMKQGRTYHVDPDTGEAKAPKQLAKLLAKSTSCIDKNGVLQKNSPPDFKIVVMSEEEYAAFKSNLTTHIENLIVAQRMAAAPTGKMPDDDKNDKSSDTTKTKQGTAQTKSPEPESTAVNQLNKLKNKYLGLRYVANNSQPTQTLTEQEKIKAEHKEREHEVLVDDLIHFLNNYDLKQQARKESYQNGKNLEIESSHESLMQQNVESKLELDGIEQNLEKFDKLVDHLLGAHDKHVTVKEKCMEIRKKITAIMIEIGKKGGLDAPNAVKQMRTLLKTYFEEVSTELLKIGAAEYASSGTPESGPEG